ncbi:FtsX-like permease family protein [Streptacidiphilus sp. MAP5-3]|uniref:FtsX-like permease family protein n=1 Tax=unclassified Streptacidiphilus TaxID=2643834 RepID=UPI003512DE25
MRSSVPWLWPRLRHRPAATVWTGVLVAALVFLTTALPLTLARYQDTALDTTLRQAPVTGRSVEASPPEGVGIGIVPGETAQTTVGPAGGAAMQAAMATAADQVEAQIGAPLRIDTSQVSWGIQAVQHAGNETGAAVSAPPGQSPGPAPDGVPPHLSVVWQPTGQLTLMTGRLPAAPAGAGAGSLEVAVSQATARTMGWHVGTRLLVPVPSVYRGQEQLTVVGTFRDPTAAESRLPYWAGASLLGAPSLYSIPAPGQTLHYWEAEVLVAPGAVRALPQIAPPEPYWWFPVASGSLNAGQVGPALDMLASLTNGDRASTLLTTDDPVSSGLTVQSDLTGLLTQFSAQRDALEPVVTIGVAGTAGTAAAVLLMVFGLATERRTAELALLRARGAGLRLLFGRLTVESAAATVPGALVGIGAALLLLPSRVWATALGYGLAVLLAATLAGPLRMLARHRGLRPARTDLRTDLVRARPSRRRTVVELFLLVLTVAAVVALRSRGLAPTGGGLDPLTAVAPVLLGLTGALLLVRCYPLPLRLAARPVTRRSGAVGFLGLARAGRGGATGSLLPLLALLLALTTTVFGATVLSGVTERRAALTTQLVGADVRVDAVGSGVPAQLATALQRLPGVRAGTGVLTDPLAQLGTGQTVVPLGLADPASYARVSASIGLGPFVPSLLTARTAGTGSAGAVPVLASPGAAAEIGSAPTTLTSLFGTMRIRLAGVLPSTPFTPGGDFVIAAQSPALAAVHWSSAAAATPSAVLLTGPVQSSAVKALIAASGAQSQVDVLDRSDAEASLDAQPLPSGAVSLYQAAALAATLLALLAVVLALLQAAPERAALLARLRTMGLRPRQGYALILTETLPMLLLAAVAGSALGAASVPLLGSAVDLGPLVGSLDGTAAVTHASPALQLLPVVLPAAVLLVLAVAVVLAEAAVIGRRQIGVQLRAGDEA